MLPGQDVPLRQPRLVATGKFLETASGAGFILLIKAIIINWLMLKHWQIMVDRQKLHNHLLGLTRKTHGYWKVHLPFLINGTVDDAIACELFNWTGKGYKIPHNLLKSVSTREDLKKTGTNSLSLGERHKRTFGGNQMEQGHTRTLLFTLFGAVLLLSACGKKPTPPPAPPSDTFRSSILSPTEGPSTSLLLLPIRQDYRPTPANDLTGDELD